MLRNSEISSAELYPEVKVIVDETLRTEGTNPNLPLKKESFVLDTERKRDMDVLRHFKSLSNNSSLGGLS